MIRTLVVADNSMGLPKYSLWSVKGGYVGSFYNSWQAAGEAASRSSQSLDRIYAFQTVAMPETKAA